MRALLLKGINMHKENLLIGYAKKDITPDFPVGLTGYGNDARRLHEAVLDPIYGICLAITDQNDQTILLYSADLLLVDAQVTAEFRAAVAAATGVKEAHILLAATHNHSAPNVTERELEWGIAYRAFFIRQMVLAGQEAMADRAPATPELATGATEKLCFTRHYVNPDGSFFGDNFGTRQDPIAGHTGAPDEQFQLIRFLRQARPDILLVNWQAHAKMCSTATSEFGKAHHKYLSADFIGYARAALEEKTHAAVIYFSGAAGNLNPDSRIPEEAPPKEPERVGKLLADAVYREIGKLQPVDSGAVLCRWKKVTVPIDHSDDGKVELAKDIWSMWAADGETCKKRAKEAGFNSAYAARDVIRRYESETDREMELGVISIGAVAFVAVPYEMFCENGMQIKENSPFAATILMTCANGYHKYIPSLRAFGHGCYEVDSRLYPKGTAENLAQILIEELNTAYVSEV